MAVVESQGVQGVIPGTGGVCPLAWDSRVVVAKSLSLPPGFLVSEWADLNRELDPMTCARPGPWRTDFVPHSRGMMDAFNDPLVEQITIMKATQVAGTESLFNMLGYAIDCDPGPAMFVATDEKVAKKVSRLRVKPMIQLSAALSKHLTGRKDDFADILYILDSMAVHWAWAGSPAALASFAIRYAFLDEVDKYPPFSGKEADPVKLVRERLRTFRASAKLVMASTPTTKDGYINREYESSDKRRYQVPCPHCGAYQVLMFDQVKFPKDQRDPERIAVERLAWYECAICNERIDDKHKRKMLHDGVWCPEVCEVMADGSIVGELPVNRNRGFWINALYSPWLTFSDVAAEFLSSKDDVAKLMNFTNSWLAQVWEERGASISEKDLVRFEVGYEKGTAPSDALVILGAADVHKHRINYIFRAWGEGNRSWLVDADVVGDFGRLEECGTRGVWRCGDGRVLGLRCGVMDKQYRTDEVYEWCRSQGGVWWPVAGSTTRMTTQWEVKKVERDALTGKYYGDSFYYYRIDPEFYKDKVTGLAREGRDLWHVYEGVSQEYKTQFINEHKVIKRDKHGRNVSHWEPKYAGAPQHFWDCEVYGVALADILGVPYMKGAVAAPAERQREGGGFQTPDGLPYLVTER